MCGIVGYSGRVSAGLLEAMSGLVAHRGPDDRGAWVDVQGGVGLAHRRLSILDLSERGHQPMADESGKVVIVFNGEIYNFAELRSELLARGRSFRSTSDTEVLLNGYLEFGVAVVDRLNGIFAFAIHDQRTRQTFLARDHMGVKPLYFAEIPGAFVFGSELKAVLAEPAVSRELDPASLLQYLTLLWCPSPGTPLKGVHKLEPGCGMLVSEGRIVRTWQFHRLRFGANPDISPRQAVEELTQRLREAVHRQMVADVPVGAFLSGGLDSSAVVAFAREVAGERGLDCFTIAPSGPELAAEGMTEDLPYAERVARHLGVRLHAIPVDAGMIGELARVIYHLDEPQADPAAINVLLISRLARSHGIKVLLSGAGGDDLFTGYRRHRALAAEKYWSWLPRPARRVMSATAAHLPGSPALLRRVGKALRDAHLDDDARMCGYFHWTPPQLAGELLQARPASPAAVVNQPLLAALHRPGHGAAGLDRMLLLEQRFFLADHNLLYSDKLSMAEGVEARVPFLDLDLVAFANDLPAAIKQRGGVGKWPLKQALEPYLPRDVIYRPKAGFGAPLRGWVRGALAPLIDEVLSPRAIGSRGLFDATSARALIEANRAGRVDASYTIFAMLSIELWCRTFVDPSQPRMLSHLPGMP
jgi:asparagine synthase (glutamine-hydrolysing)